MPSGRPSAEGEPAPGSSLESLERELASLEAQKREAVAKMRKLRAFLSAWTEVHEAVLRCHDLGMRVLMVRFLRAEVRLRAAQARAREARGEGGAGQRAAAPGEDEIGELEAVASSQAPVLDLFGPLLEGADRDEGDGGEGQAGTRRRGGGEPPEGV